MHHGSPPCLKSDPPRWACDHGGCPPHYGIHRSIWKKNRRSDTKRNGRRRHFRANTRKSQSLRLSKIGQIVGGVRREGNESRRSGFTRRGECSADAKTAGSRKPSGIGLWLPVFFSSSFLRISDFEFRIYFVAATATSPRSVTGWPRGSFTTRTEQEASRNTFSATLPSTSRSTPVRPCVPMTIRSMPASRP